MIYTLGINAYHADSSACLLRDGAIVAAAEEERFLRIKHWSGFPKEAIAYCLTQAGISLEQVQHVAINRDPRANLVRKVAYTLLRRPELKLVKARLQNRSEVINIARDFQQAFPQYRLRAELHHVEHHLAHTASAYLVSPFESAVVISVDGFGDFASAAWGVGEGQNLQLDGKVYFPHSLGVFYQALTQYLGFPHYGDEYKVMGLAPYGRPKFVPQMRQIVHLKPDGTYELDLHYFRHATESVDYSWHNCAPDIGILYSPALEELLGPSRGKADALEQRHRDIARSVQVMYEEAFFHLLNRLYERYKLPNLTVAGGCGMNSVANGKVTRNTPFKHVYIQSAAGDAGGALGAAYVVVQRVVKDNPRFYMDHAYWGPESSPEEITKLVAAQVAQLKDSGCRVERIGDEAMLCEKTAVAIAEGKVVGWFQGRMEWGPRALGNRSIVCDPRRADMKDILNLKIKRRESFRPFAPSILREAVTDWFETDDDVPFMMKVFQIRPERRSLIPAVTHVDGSGRLQTVYRHTNPRYYRLIETFGHHTGVPIVLNTSFNENEPVVCRPEEALDCFLRTKMDILVLGEHFIERTAAD